MTFYEQILFWAKIHPEKLAILYRDEGLTYAELASAVSVAQSKLVAAGHTRQDVAALTIENPILRMPMLLALLGMGITSLNCTQDNVLSTLTLGATFVLSERKLRLPEKCKQINVNRSWFCTIPGQAITPASSPPFGLGQAATVWFSSGSTGNPRPLATNWTNMTRLVANRQWRTNRARYERGAIVPTMASYFGSSEALSFLAAGVGIVFIHDERTIIQQAELLAFDCLVMSAVQMKTIVDIARADGYRFHLLRGAMFGGGQASAKLMSDALVFICRDIEVHYGATETGPASGVKCASILEHPSSVGHVAPWASVRIVDSKLNDVPSQTEGEILISTDSFSLPYRGPNVIYSRSDSVWVRPGDKGYLDGDQTLHITGRMTDVVNIGGEKIAPEHIEEILCRHAQIKSAAAIGKMTETSGVAALCVFLVVDGSLSNEDIHAWWRLHGISVPLDHIKFVDALPMTESGKIFRNSLSEMPFS